ncbi:enoyl-CoA hydratase [Bacillus manliponensis]|uniref:Enoyl-CoA hydratase n=1 Tax=Bacillus manliponensis TaxID=574376 RepID=A0A073K4R1_9BACI|nr:enoyl-CoA hydratase [Bacillus manliponensis]KEK21531.1 enoyl-CoA hydratase [Bacillus manliponensis]
MKIGDIITFEKRFTKEDVEIFSKISGDAGEHHVTPDENGRVMVQGLLVATLPTKIGGDLNFIARNADFTFLRPVFTEDTIRCEVTLIHYEEQEDRIIMASKAECFNQHDKKVLEGKFQGIIRK